MIKKTLIACLVLGISKLSSAAPCCGGTANIPSLISGDDLMQFSTTLVSTQVVAESPVGGGIKYRKPNDKETAQTLRLDFATLISDRWQTGVTIPLTRRTRARGTTEASAWGLNDISLSLGYEVLPYWSYSLWRPKALLFASATLPTGGSIYDAKELYRIDSRGRGFYSVSAGSLLLKNWEIWDLSLVMEAHQPFARRITNENGILDLKPGWGASGSLAAGISPMGGNFRLGFSLLNSYDSPIATEGIVSGRGEKVSLWTAATQASYLASPTLSMSLIYSDQTFVKASNNAALNRSLAFLLQKRWER